MPSNIRIERVRNNISQVELAKMIGVNKVSIRHWEKDIKSCKIANLITLCDVFDVSADYLIGLTEERARR